MQSDELRRRIVADINSDAHRPGAKLGSERELAERYGTSRSSLRQVLAVLEESGMIHRIIGRAGGIFISRGQVERTLTDVAGVPAFLASQGFEAGTRVLSTRIATPDRATRQALQLGPGDLVVDVERVRLADGTPISLEQAQFPAEMVPGLLDQQLGGSLYELLENSYGMVVTQADERIEAVNATAREAALLGVDVASAVLLITRVGRSALGTPCEYSRDVFRGDRTFLAVSANGRGIRHPAHASTASVALQGAGH